MIYHLKYARNLSFVLCLWLVGLSQALSLTVILHDDKAEIFDEHKTKGTFVLYDVQSNKLHLVNSARAYTPFIPASTFKIANSLIALETGVIEDEHEVIPYGGGRVFIQSWAEDMPLGRAFAISNVPVFQELARRIGLERYQMWQERLEYGNARIGQDVETFWLRGPLEISAIEQAKFIAKLATQKLPLSKQTQQLVADISKLQVKDGKTLHGKTGWTTTPHPDIGWFVGWVQNGDRTHAFALNIDMASRKDAGKRRAIAEKLLATLAIY